MIKKRILVKYIGILFFILIFFTNSAFAGLFIINQQYKICTSTILYVGGGGPGNYTLIQDAIDNAVDGDTIFVFDDSSPYKEILFVDKSISLIGEDRESTIVDGNYQGTVVDIRSDDVLVCGFTLKNCFRSNVFDYNVVNLIGCQNVIVEDNAISLGLWEVSPSVAGIYVLDSSYNFIQGNIIFDDSNCGRTFGVTVDGGSSSGNNLSDNEIYDFSNGIYLESGDNVVFGNYLHHNNDGIENRGTGNIFFNNVITKNEDGIANYGATNTLISKNIVVDNGDGGEFDSGIKFNGGSDNIVIDNNISNNHPTGIHLLGDKNYIKNNYISNNSVLGIYIASINNEITENNIIDNGEFGIGIISGFNTISRNNLINNKINAHFSTVILGVLSINWDNNYWSDYKGTGPYVIRGIISILIFFRLPFIDLDRHPASKPYDIEV